MKKFLFACLCSSLFATESELVVGTTSGYAPFVSLNEQGKYEGFDIDFSEQLAQKLNKKLVIKDCGSMPSLMMALKQKKIDLLIWAVSITEERQKAFNMVYYQGPQTTEMPVVFWEKIPEGITKIEDLNDIAIEAGSFQAEVIGNYSQITTKFVDKVDDAVMEIRYGKSKAALIDPALVTKYQSRFKQVKVLKLPLAPSEQSLGNGICIAKDRTELYQAVIKAVEELRLSGEIAKLENKWGLTNE